MAETKKYRAVKYGVLKGVRNVLLIVMISGFYLSCDRKNNSSLSSFTAFSALESLTASNTGPFLIKLEHLHHIKSQSEDDPVLRQEVDSVITRSNKLLDRTFLYVVDKEHIPPSGDRHDYMSLHRYSYYNPDTGKYDIIRDGRTNPEIYEYDRHNLDMLSGAVYTLAMGYYYTGDESFAEKAAELLYNWFLNPETRMNPNMKFSNIRPGVGVITGLIDSRDFIKVIDAASILYESNHWSPDLHYDLKKWFVDFYAWMLDLHPGGAYHPHYQSNVSTWMDVQRVIFLLFTEQEERINSKHHVHPVQERMNDQILANGSQPAEASRSGGTSQHYVYFNLAAYMQLSLLRKNQFERVGYDRDWNVIRDCVENACEHGGLKAAIENIALYMLSAEKVNTLFDINEDFDECRYLEIFRMAAVAFESNEYERTVQHLLNQGCRNPNILLAYSTTGLF